ncbi:hypothetical protein H8E88_04165 [candidate division KSB1 bacterium]|nr:hypothetical protein [candidate division KSB1 bacterium]
MKASMIFICVAFLSVLLCCASLNQGLTPGVKTTISDFDNSVEVVQKAVSAASSLSEGWHTLGFRWNSKAPNTIFLTVGTKGIVNVTGVSFNIDGNIVDAEIASTLTDYDQWSTRQFSMPLDQFRKLATAKIVKMKVIMIDKYSVSSFGQTKQNAIVSGKFSEFIRQVNAQLEKKGY